MGVGLLMGCAGGVAACSSHTSQDPPALPAVESRTVISEHLEPLRVSADTPRVDWAALRYEAREEVLGELATERARLGELLEAEVNLELAEEGMPRNTRRVAEGYWVGSKPDAEEIRALHQAGVRLIISATRLKPDARDVSDTLGVERLTVWFGRSFPDEERILAAAQRYHPSEVFVHCDHGGDRSGAILAFLLTTLHGWRADHAMLAVVFPTHSDVRGLIRLLEDSGARVSDEERVAYVGIYSGERNGGYGGLKVRGPGYEQMVSTTLAAMASSGVEIED